MTCVRLKMVEGSARPASWVARSGHGIRADLSVTAAGHQHRAFEHRLLVQLQNVSFLAVVNAIRLERAVDRLEP